MSSEEDLRKFFPALYTKTMTITYIRPDGVHVTLDLPVGEAFLLQKELNRRLSVNE